MKAYHYTSQNLTERPYLEASSQKTGIQNWELTLLRNHLPEALKCVYFKVETTLEPDTFDNEAYQKQYHLCIYDLDFLLSTFPCFFLKGDIKAIELESINVFVEPEKAKKYNWFKEGGGLEILGIKNWRQDWKDFQKQQDWQLDPKFLQYSKILRECSEIEIEAKRKLKEEENNSKLMKRAVDQLIIRKNEDIKIYIKENPSQIERGELLVHGKIPIKDALLIEAFSFDDDSSKLSFLQQGLFKISVRLKNIKKKYPLT